MIDFSDCHINGRTYNGANGSKIGITYNNTNYLLKFSPKPKSNAELSYTNSCFSEDISCKILKTFDLNSQDTMLGTYSDKIVVACKKKKKKGHRFADFASLKNTIIDSENNGYGTELSEILYTIDEQKTYDINENKIKEFFWDMFIADSLLGNFDRHNGNWGFLVEDENSRNAKIAPIYDCGSCLYPQVDVNLAKSILTNKEELEKRVYVFPTFAIKIDNVKINPYNFLTQTDNKDCLKSLKKITERIDLKKINGIIDDTPIMADIQKDFLKTMIKARKELILEVALVKNRDKNIPMPSLLFKNPNKESQVNSQENQLPQDEQKRRQEQHEKEMETISSKLDSMHENLQKDLAEVNHTPTKR